MGDLSKTLDTFIKAPLWLFLALALAATAPLVPLQAVKAVGLNSEMKLGGLPIAVFAILFWSLFFTSAAARGFAILRKNIGSFADKAAVMKRYRQLSNEARWLLAGIEENEVYQLAIPRNELAVRELRDAGLIEYVKQSGTDVMNGIYEPTLSFKTDIIYHRAKLRKFLRKNLSDVSDFSQRIEAANRQAQGF